MPTDLGMPSARKREAQAQEILLDILTSIKDADYDAVVGIMCCVICSSECELRPPEVWWPTFERTLRGRAVSNFGGWGWDDRREMENVPSDQNKQQMKITALSELM